LSVDTNLDIKRSKIVDFCWWSLVIAEGLGRILFGRNLATIKKRQLSHGRGLRWPLKPPDPSQ